LWRFVEPLFYESDGLSLSFSWPLRHDSYISFVETSRKELAQEFVKRVEPRLHEAKQITTLEQFALCFDERPALRENDVTQMVYGYTLALLGRKQEAWRCPESC
jgi:hypothetical protein